MAEEAELPPPELALAALVVELPAAEDLECLRDVEQVLLQRRRVHRTIVCVNERTPAQRARGPREPAVDRRKAPCAGHAQGQPRL